MSAMTPKLTEAEIHEMFFGIPKQYRANAVWRWIGTVSAWRKLRRWLRERA